MSKQDDARFIAEIEKLHQYIKCNCLEYLSDLSENNRRSAQRIANASELLYIDAAKIARKQNSDLNLSLNMINAILYHICQILINPTPISKKEEYLNSILNKNNIILYA